MIIQAFELLKPFLVLMIKTVWGVISSIWQFGVEFIKYFLSYIYTKINTNNLFCPPDPTTNSKTSNSDLSRICESMNHTFKTFLFSLLQFQRYTFLFNIDDKNY